jgi:beta-lactamase class A
VAHKFGEWGNGYEKELHETGIVYIADNPYILTVMTNGRDWNALSGVIAQVSKTVYDHMSQNGKRVAMK